MCLYLEWRDVRRSFCGFRNSHIVADQVHFYEFNSTKLIIFLNLQIQYLSYLFLQRTITENKIRNKFKTN